MLFKQILTGINSEGISLPMDFIYQQYPTGFHFQSRTNWLLCILAVAYVALVRLLRYRRARSIKLAFHHRPLSSMTVPEAFLIMQKLQELEFPSAMKKARTMALLKVL